MIAFIIFLCSIFFANRSCRSKNEYTKVPVDNQQRRRDALINKIVSGYLYVPFALEDLEKIDALNLIPDQRIAAELDNHLRECRSFLESQSSEDAYDKGVTEDFSGGMEFIDLQNTNWLMVPEI